MRWPRSLGGRGARRQLPAATPADYLADKLLNLAPTYEAVVTLHAPLAEARARLGDAVADLVPVDDNRCTLRSKADTAEWLTARLAALGCEFDIHQPPALIDHLRSVGDRLLRATS